MAAPDEPEKTLEARGVICGDWKLVHTYRAGSDGARVVSGKYLFNVRNDPKESSNLFEDNPVKVRHLTERMNAWWNPSLGTTPVPR